MVSKNYDVIVVGAGIAGICAAIRAGEKGLKVALIEKHNFIGGVARNCLHNFICGIFINDEGRLFSLANEGMSKDIYDYLFGLYGNDCLVKRGKVKLMAFKQNDLWSYLMTRLKEVGVDLHLRGECIDVVSSGKKMDAVFVKSKQGIKDIEKLTANVFIDSASGNLTYVYNKDLVDSPSARQLCGYCVKLSDTLMSEKTNLLIPYIAKKVVKRLNAPEYLQYVTISVSPIDNKPVIKFSLFEDKDIEIVNYILHEIFQKLRSFNNSKIIQKSDYIAERSVKRISNSGKIDGYNFISAWPCEFWDENQGPVYEYPEGGYCCFDINTLKSDGCENLFAAGACIGVEEKYQSSIRAMGTCIRTGELASELASSYLMG